MKKSLRIVGWREWVVLPELGITQIKAKIDTGARTSALHAFCVEPFEENGKNKIRFGIHPIQRNDQQVQLAVADVVDKRYVTDSGGHREERYVIQTPICVGEEVWPIEMTLTNRDIMQFRMLLGRTALKGHCLVNPNRSYLLEKNIFYQP